MSAFKNFTRKFTRMLGLSKESVKPIVEDEKSKNEWVVLATDTTAEFFKMHGVSCEPVRKASEPTPNVLNLIENKKVSFVVNLSKTEVVVKNRKKKEKGASIISDGFRIRRATVDNQIPLFTDLHLVRAFIKSLAHYSIDNLEIKSYREYLE